VYLIVVLCGENRDGSLCFQVDMGIVTLCFFGGFRSNYPCWSLPHSYEGNPVQSYSGFYGVVVYVFQTAFWSLCIFQSHGCGLMFMVFTSTYLRSRL
jgi:hypothetical protein